MSVISDADRQLMDRFPSVFRPSLFKRFLPLVLVFGVVLYFFYAAWFFALPKVLAEAKWERAGTVLSQWISYDVSLEYRLGQRELKPKYPRFSPLGNDPHPDWIKLQPDGRINVEVDGPGRSVGFTPTEVLATNGPETVRFSPGGTPQLASGADRWVTVGDTGVTLDYGWAGDVKVSGDRVKIRKRFLGWANFLFDINSPYFGKSAGEVIGLMFSPERLDPKMSNLELALDNIWNNAGWQHGDVWVKLLQTVVMAFAGTLLAALITFPLSFLAARTITASRLTNFGLKRFFDFLRSVDTLIWALFFTRAFGPGPLAGIGSIFLTEVGTLGKLYAEGLENIDDKQREGLKSTGADPINVQRYGVVPQVLPVMVSQTLYQWESNTRSATIIGAVGAGGIGLKLWEAMRTNSNWGNVFYMVLLILAVVFVFDAISNAVRTRLIGRVEH
jgi:phosphonate transport system permease protein